MHIDVALCSGISPLKLEDVSMSSAPCRRCSEPLPRPHSSILPRPQGPHCHHHHVFLRRRIGSASSRRRAVSARGTKGESASGLCGMSTLSPAAVTPLRRSAVDVRKQVPVG